MLRDLNFLCPFNHHQQQAFYIQNLTSLRIFVKIYFNKILQKIMFDSSKKWRRKMQNKREENYQQNLCCVGTLIQDFFSSPFYKSDTAE